MPLREMDGVISIAAKLSKNARQSESRAGCIKIVGAGFAKNSEKL